MVVILASTYYMTCLVNLQMFNIELHDQVVVADLDIFAVVGKDVPMNIVVNFNVTIDPQDGVTKFISTLR